MTHGSRPAKAASRTSNLPKSSAAKPKPAQATVLVRLALDGYELVHGPDGEPLGLPRGAPPIARDFRAGRSGLRRELASAYFDHYGAAPSASAMIDALGVLEGLAARGRLVEPALRVGRGPEGELVLDLGRDDGLAAIVSPAGWRVKSTPVVFRRTPLTGALPLPEQPGDLAALWELARVAEEDRALLLGCLIATLMPELDHPVLGFLGEAGSGKTAAARALVTILDASPAPLRAAPRDVIDWVVSAAASWSVESTTCHTLSRGSATPWRGPSPERRSCAAASIRTQTSR
jgi:hypothetical protein